MHLHEYQSKKFLKRYGINHPPFFIVESLKEAKEHLAKREMDEAILKIQVHAGGRGKAGGVKRAKGEQQILTTTEELLNLRMVNRQTGPSGVTPDKIMIGPLTSIKKEYYLAISLDRKEKRAVLIASTEGGMEIEEVATNSPEKILTLPIYDDGRLRNFQILILTKFMGWHDHVKKQGGLLAQNLVLAFFEMDATLLEINPLILDEEDNLQALDAKVTIDDNALFRQPALKACEDLNQLPQQERKAHEVDLAYIALDGTIGCMVNGAGLAMATMDLIKLYGGEPANFLDVGGGATEEKITEGFKLLLSDKRVRAILVNIFGGIMNCETIAKGIIQAASDTKISVPLVVRMEGTNVDKGRQLLADSGLAIISCHDLKEAAEQVVAKGV